MNPARPRLWVIDPSLNVAEDQGVAEILDDWPGESRVFHPVLRPGDGPGPDTGHGLDGIVLMGSAASVHDDDPWLADLASWLDPVLQGELRVPLLGICFGHQLVAHLTGGEVGFLRSDRAKRVGVERTSLERFRLLPRRKDLRVVVSHREEVMRPPPDYTVCGWRSGVAVDAMHHERLDLFSVQFHPEAREEFASRAGFDPMTIDDRVREDSRQLIGAFHRRVLEAAGKR